MSFEMMIGFACFCVSCFAVAYVMFTVRRWVIGSKLSSTSQEIVFGVCVIVLMLALFVGSIPLLEPVCMRLISKDVSAVSCEAETTGRTR